MVGNIILPFKMDMIPLDCIYAALILEIKANLKLISMSNFCNILL